MHSDHKFNDDLLLSEQDRKLASRLYPEVSHVLDDPALREAFSKYDEPANRAKRSGRRAGACAIVCVALALAIASFEHLLHPGQEVLHPGQEELKTGAGAVGLAVLAALLGALGAIIGGIGALFAGKKHRWLCQRLMTERLRQFHFQTFVFRLPEILASLKDEETRADFTAQRRLWLEAFLSRVEHKLGAELATVLDDEACADAWLHGHRNTPMMPVSEELAPLFRAYRELRIRHQLDYASYKLSEDTSIISALPHRQAAVLSTAGFICLVLMCAVHVGLLFGVFSPKSVAAAFRSEGANVAVIWIAIVALALRALEQGLQPEREIERYQQYRSAVRAILDRYDAAPTLAAKRAIMVEMERLSYDELRNFLLTNSRARFVM